MGILRAGCAESTPQESSICLCVLKSHNLTVDNDCCMNGFRRIYIDILFFFSPSPEKLISLDGLENYAKFRAVPMNMTNRWRFLCTFRGIFHLIRACGMISFPLIHVDVNVVNINDNVHIATI